MIEIEIGIVDNKRPPVGDIIIAYLLFPLRTFDDRENKMYVRMYQLIEFYAGRTDAASISLAPVGAADITFVSNS